MAMFSIGGGQQYKMAKALASGSPVRIVQIEVKESKIKRNDGEAQFQTMVVFESLGSGTTMAFEKGPAGKRITVPAEEYAEGDRFVHYYGGIYQKDDGGWRISERGGTFALLSTLKELGIPITGKFEDYVGVEMTLERARGIGAQGVYYTPMPLEVTGRSAGDEAGEGDEEAAAPTPRIKPRPSFKKPAPAAGDNAFLALSQEDQDAVKEYIAEVGGTGFAEAGDLVGVVAKDEEHAKAIIAGVTA